MGKEKADEADRWRVRAVVASSCARALGGHPVSIVIGAYKRRRKALRTATLARAARCVIDGEDKGPMFEVGTVEVLPPETGGEETTVWTSEDEEAILRSLGLPTDR